MLETIRYKISRLKEAKAWILSNTNVNIEIFKAKFKDVEDILNEIKPVEVKPVQYVKQQPTSSFVTFQ